MTVAKLAARSAPPSIALPPHGGFQQPRFTMPEHALMYDLSSRSMPLSTHFLSSSRYT